MEKIYIKKKQKSVCDKRDMKMKRKLYILISIVGVLLFISLIGKYIAPYNALETNPKMASKAPSALHIFGTDNFGRDVFSRTLVGARTSIFASVALVAFTFTFGSLFGVVSAYYGGIVDTIFMRITDILLSFPDMIIGISVAGILGGGLLNAMIALGVTGWTQYARIARSQVLRIKEENYVKAAKLEGNNNFRIMTVYIVPNIIAPLIVTATLHISTMMISLAGLSFLGLGVKLPHPEWGSMISEGSKFLQTAPWIALLPSLVMIFVIVVFNLLGDTISDVLDPKRRNG